uniref:Uncharacterized protein n=1 Tax=Timema bartmani TaxID=61472 RepID=A0A7R9F395_9NEOP|nr:unnamed protein product [Timema bartmani]
MQVPPLARPRLDFVRGAPSYVLRPIIQSNHVITTYTQCCLPHYTWRRPADWSFGLTFPPALLIHGHFGLMEDPVNSLCPSTISRAEWGARTPAVEPQRPWRSLLSPTWWCIMGEQRSTATTRPRYRHVTSRKSNTSLSSRGREKNTCSAIVRSYQNYHIDTKGWNDIGYSFVIGEDGHVYEGRGWDFIGAHAPGYNTQSIGICVIGDFSDRLPNEEALTTLSELISCGVDIGKIGEGYHVIGHRQARDTLCPGDTLYKWVEALPQWTDHPVPLT